MTPDRRETLTAVDILLFIVKHQGEFPNLRGLSPVQVLARLPEKDERFKLGEEELKEVLRKVNRT